jgi:hypothetical protein
VCHGGSEKENKKKSPKVSQNGGEGVTRDNKKRWKIR